MCGLAGSFLSAWDVRLALDRIAHRGPDGWGELRHGDTHHGHVRLAVLDLSSASDQPFRRGDGVLSFNGEIWNYRELRADLSALGCKFRTTGDTEVLAAALERWGPDALDKVEGMFALAWTRGHVALLARDRFGKVPLYIRRSRESFEWASERKAWGPGMGAAASPLPPGTRLDLRTGKVHRWYSAGGSTSIRRDLLDLLRRSIERRLVSDAPLCVLVSGGLDSGLVLALARESLPGVVAYTAKFREDADDLLAARRLCAELDVPLSEVQVPDPSLELVEEAVRTVEIQSKAQTEIALLCLPLARRISADGFKVCLSGEASDELFGGYGNMAIAASQPGADWQAIRLAQLAKMARGNFVRCNKAFMSAGVECRLPFMDRELVEAALSMSKVECPPGKGALKRAAADVLPVWVIKRQKDTFQGSSGMAKACARLVASPTALYNAVGRRLFGGTVEA